MAIRVFLALALGFLLQCSAAEAPAAGSLEPLALLELHCVKCHGGGKIKGGLNLTTRSGLLQGGDTGPAVIPGDAEHSLLMQMVRQEKDPGMPYKEPKLADAVIARIAAWIKEGANYTRVLQPPLTSPKTPPEFTLTAQDRSHWAFQPIRRPAVPSVMPNSSSRPVVQPLDRFILAKLQAAGLSFAPPADRITLIRRVTFDLIGLPPTPAEVDAFVADTSSDAYEKVLDRLLASPHYGERWGRHWLDLARYAESDGYEHDAVRPHSWRYRDYVIRAFNQDKPYDRFVREQIAGDELWPDDPAAQIATGFNLLGPDMVDSSDQVQRRHNTLNDMTDTTALAFLGLTLGCARCHDHKFEPLSQRDYYRLQACFAPAAFRREQTVATIAERASSAAALKQYEENPQVRALAELENPVRARIHDGKLAKLAPEARAAHQTLAARRNAEQANLVLETESQVAVTEKELADALSPEEKQQRKELQNAIQKLPRPAPLPKAMTLARDNSSSAKTFILQRGDYNQPGDAVEAGFPGVLLPPVVPPVPPENPRTALANWLASPDNPLTARVMVNRIWQHHFGQGLVASPSDFGTHGQRPTHPELLDWLAHEFIAQGWSLKQMHKLMLMSRTYQQSSSSSGAKNDPENKLYGRMNRLRLEGEVIRDSLLAISGELNGQMGGPGVSPPLPENIFKGATGWIVSKDPRDRSRRSVYIFARRNLRFPFLEVFDAPDNNLSCPGREHSTTAPQALTLLNADEVMAAAQATARRIRNDPAVHSDTEVIAPLFRQILGRPPRSEEIAATQKFLAQSPLSELCRALFNLNDFVYVE